MSFDLYKNPNKRYSITADEDATYMAAVQAGDMETAQRMVDEATEKSMPDSKLRTEDGKLRKVYHGTNSGDFNVFNEDYIGMASGDDGYTRTHARAGGMI